MTAKVVYTSAPPDGITGSLFEGKKFWLSYNVPQRSKFREFIQYNGGVVVQLEKDADIKLVDHVKRDAPPDSFSYQYVENCIRSGRLVSLEAHRVGPAEPRPRPMGASHIPARAHRKQFTKEDDEILLEWVKQSEKSGLATAGMKMYETLAQQHPQHTSQSWRNRYVKNFRGQRLPAALSAGTHRISTGDTNRAASSESARTREQSESSRSGEIARPPLRETDAGSHEASRSTSKPARSHNLNSSQRAPSTPVDQEEFQTQAPLRSPYHTPVLPQRPPGHGQEPSRSDMDTVSSKAPDRAQQNTTRTEEHARKRRRISHDMPTFELGPQRESKRRVTTYDPSVLPSTPIQPPIEAEKAEERPAPVTSDDETQSEDQFETAPQPETQRPSQADDNLLRELPFLPSSPSDQEDPPERQKEVINEIDHWIDTRVSTGRAQSEQQAIHALRCTCIDLDLADAVLKHLAKGKGIPQNIPGVWTPEDDKRLLGSNAREVERSIEKHGMELAKIRKRHLRMAQSA
ncbi:conserved hypothetical protein [Paecilomyces variotii No. 5]|uniref:DNA-binding protein RAP1 n=1 Tax=Byssochlamys spectabilis (strain No. 5 / NBRC 109023) TaxID=1356009 RepID=V5G9J7_BYSSN|nr:conserved hypothetical protein [Paecilomyces variotii No. 5]